MWLIFTKTLGFLATDKESQVLIEISSRNAKRQMATFSFLGLLFGKLFKARPCLRSVIFVNVCAGLTSRADQQVPTHLSGLGLLYSAPFKEYQYSHFCSRIQKNMFKSSKQTSRISRKVQNFQCQELADLVVGTLVEIEVRWT